MKKLLQKIRSIPEIEEKTQTDLKELRDFTDIQKICKLRQRTNTIEVERLGS